VASFIGDEYPCGFGGGDTPMKRILPQLDLTDELVYLSLFIKKHEIELRKCGGKA
jgi:hypothetical protein